jgi:hypothetical protein
MSQDQAPKQLEDDLRRELERLSVAELREVIDKTHSFDEVMDLAASSRALSENLNHLLDEDFEQMPAHVRNRLGTVAERPATTATTQPNGLMDGAVTSTVRRWFRLLRDSIPRGSGDLVVVSAETQEGPGWPCPAEIDVEGLIAPVQVEFSWLTFDMTMRYTGPSDGPTLRIVCDTIEPDSMIALGGLVLLGPLEHFGLSATSSKDAIRQSLMDHGFRLDLP